MIQSACMALFPLPIAGVISYLVGLMHEFTIRTLKPASLAPPETSIKASPGNRGTNEGLFREASKG